jgi:hypothetical protein
MTQPHGQEARAEITLEGWIEGPRWSGLADAVEQAAIAYAVHRSITERKGFLRTTVYYTVTGQTDRVRGFQRALAAAVEEANA